MLLAAAEIAPAVVAGGDVKLAHAQELRLWEEAARLTADPDFGLHFAEWLAPRTADVFGALAFAVRSCATLGDQLRLVTQYSSLVHNEILLTLELEADHVLLVHTHRRAPPHPTRHPVEGLLTLAVLIARQETGDDFSPVAVHFRHPRPNNVEEHGRVFGAPVHFGTPVDALVLDYAHLARPQRRSEPQLLALLDKQLAGLHGEHVAPTPLRHRVRRELVAHLPKGEPSVGTVAARLQMSPRTLQRQLQSEGTSFAAVLGDLRRELAARYLRDPHIAIAEVAFLLGFQDISAFYRAFRRWEGMTPLAFRRGIPDREGVGTGTGPAGRPVTGQKNR